MNGGTVVTRPQGEDDFRILRNFMYKGQFSATPDAQGKYHLLAPNYAADPRTLTYYNINSFIDLNNIYGGLDKTAAYEEYTCTLFKKNDDYKYFTGDKSASIPLEKTGVRYVTNRIQSVITDSNAIHQP